MLKPIVLTLCGFLFGAAATGQVAGQTPRASVPASEVNGKYRKVISAGPKFENN